MCFVHDRQHTSRITILRPVSSSWPRLIMLVISIGIQYTFVIRGVYQWNTPIELKIFNVSPQLNHLQIWLALWWSCQSPQTFDLVVWLLEPVSWYQDYSWVMLIYYILIRCCVDEFAYFNHHWCRFIMFLSYNKIYPLSTVWLGAMFSQVSILVEIETLELRFVNSEKSKNC